MLKTSFLQLRIDHVVQTNIEYTFVSVPFPYHSVDAAFVTTHKNLHPAIAIYCPNYHIFVGVQETETINPSTLRLRDQYPYTHAIPENPNLY